MKLAICMYVLRLCIARHWHCRIGRRPTSGVAISTYGLSIFADHCWHCPPSADDSAKATSPVALPCLLCGARFTTYGVRTEPALYRYPPSRPSGTSPVPDKNVHDHLPLPCTAATAFCAQVDVQTNSFTHSIPL